MVIDLQRVGILVEMVNAAHLMGPGRVWNWCLSGVKNVTVDIGAEIKINKLPNYPRVDAYISQVTVYHGLQPTL